MATITFTTTFTNFSTVERSGSTTNFDWRDPSNAGVDDVNSTFYWPPTANAWPGSSFNQITDYLECKELFTKIPSSATINGIRIGAKGRNADASGKAGNYEYVEAKDSHVIFYLNDIAISDNKADLVDFWPDSSAGFYYYGSLSDNWNISSLTPALINDTTFAIRFAATFDTVNTDKNNVPFGYRYIQIEISYEISYEDTSVIAPTPITSGEIDPTNHKLSAIARIYSSGLDTTTTNTEVTNNTRLMLNIRPGSIPTDQIITSFNKINRSINPNGIPSDQVITSTNRINRSISPGGISTGQIITSTNRIKRSISPGGIPTGQITTSTNTFDKSIRPYGIPSGENVNNKARFNRSISPIGIITREDTDNNNNVKPAVWRINANTTIGSEQTISNIHALVTLDVYIRPIPIETAEDTIQNNYVVSPGTYIFPFSIQSAENLSNLHRLFGQARILPPGQNTEENANKHRFRKEDKPIVWQNQIYSPAYEVGYFDCLAISKDLNNDPFYDLSFNSLNTNYFFSVSQYDLQFNQPTKMNQRLAGEGASPNTFAVSTLDNTLTLTMPVRVESLGYVDQCFAALYDYTIQGYKGTPTTFVGRLVSPTPLTAIGSTTFMKIDNIADFKSLGTNFTAYIKSDDDSETNETVTIFSVNKEEKRLYFLAATTNDHTPSKSYIWAAPTRPTSDREPTFSLFSLREGLFSGCIVDKLSMTLIPGNNIVASFTIKFTELDRRYQVNFRENFNSIIANVTKKRPNYLLNSSLLRLYRTTPEVGYFNLGLAEDYKLFRGYQERHFRDFEINEMSLEINNNLQNVYTSNSKNSKDVENLRKNLQPYAYYSNGRTIEGTIKYSSPIKPWLFEEVLSGPGSNNSGGIIYDFGPFKLTLPDVVWARQLSSSSMDQVHQKTVSWCVATHGLTFNPYLIPTGVY
jgi:hypothetical protein